MRAFLGTPLPSLMLMGAFFWVSHQPGSDIELPAFPHSDKALHTAAYAVLGSALALWCRWRKPRPLSPFLAASIGILFGLSDEFHQSFVPMREAGWADAVADAIGVMLGTGIVQATAARRSVKSGPRSGATE